MALIKSIQIFLLLCTYYIKADVNLPFLKPCTLKDLECFKTLWQGSVEYLSIGVQELDLPPLDPLEISNVKIQEANLFEVNFIKGVMKGYKTCVIDDYKWTSLEKGKFGAEIELHCNITIKGRYNGTAASNLLPGLSSGEEFLRADGEMNLKLQAVKIKFILDFKVTKNEAGQNILIMKTPINYKYEVPGPVILKANKIFLGNEDISDFAVNFINTTWRILIDRFGAPFFKRAMQIIGDVQKKFFYGVPVVKYIADDIESYVI